MRTGRFARRQEADAQRGRLEALGLGESWVATEGGALEDPAFELRRGEAWLLVPGRWLEVSAPPDVGIPWGEAHYRGQILIFLNERGQLNVEFNQLERERVSINSAADSLDREAAQKNKELEELNKKQDALDKERAELEKMINGN